MHELYQAEWCPYSSKVRQCMTEYNVAYIARQVAANRDERSDLLEATGEKSIPALVTDDGTTISDTNEIISWVKENYDEPESAEAHREKAAKH